MSGSFVQSLSAEQKYPGYAKTHQSKVPLCQHLCWLHGVSRAAIEVYVHKRVDSDFSHSHDDLFRNLVVFETNFTLKPADHHDPSSSVN